MTTTQEYNRTREGKHRRLLVHQRPAQRQRRKQIIKDMANGQRQLATHPSERRHHHAINYYLFLQPLIIHQRAVIVKNINFSNDKRHGASRKSRHGVFSRSRHGASVFGSILTIIIVIIIITIVIAFEIYRVLLQRLEQQRLVQQRLV